MDGMGKTFFFLIFLFSLLNPYMIRDLEGIWFRWITWSKIQVWLPGYGFWFGIWNEKSYWFKQFQQLGDILGWENDAHHFGAQKVLTRLGKSFFLWFLHCHTYGKLPPFSQAGELPELTRLHKWCLYEMPPPDPKCHRIGRYWRPIAVGW